MSEPILFYGRSKPAFFCSNFYPAPFHLDGKLWETSEHYFQAQKFLDEGSQELIRKTKGPGPAAKLGRDRSLPIRRDWERVKDGIMRTALVAKFTQNPDIKAELLATGDAKLIEDSSIDPYWCWGADHKGKNMLGILLMQVREQLR